MDQITKTYCDCCGQEIVTDATQIPYSSKYYIRRIYRYVGSNGNDTSLEVDLCDTCKENIDTAIDAIFNPVVEEEINNEIRYSEKSKIR